MESSRRRNNKNNFEINDLDRKVDQFLEAGRQFVDGVSGTRPGSRRRGRFNRLSRSNINDLGRWVSDKVDSILEEDESDDWYGDRESNNQLKYFSRDIDSGSSKENFMNKRPLKARSLRDLNKPSTNNPERLLYPVEDWPEEDDFKINKWQRSSNESQEINFEKNNEISRTPKTKSFPKSSRRRI